VDVVVARPAYTEQPVDVVDKVAVAPLPVVHLVGGAPTFWGARFAGSSRAFVHGGAGLLVSAEPGRFFLRLSTYRAALHGRLRNW
jgi:hypothetical protein